VPWVHGVEQKYGTQGLRALAVHSPSPYRDAENTRNAKHVKAVADDYDIKEPVYIDHDRSFFEALGATYHPEFYLVDKKGQIRAVEKGAQIAGSASTKRMEALIEKLLAE
jgi:hypothetical protein